jgi:hypothetical protein
LGADDWVRGRGEDATGKPSFDRSNAYRTDRDTGMASQVKDREVDHNRHHTEFELHHNAGTTHAPEAHDYSKRHVPSYERRGNNNDQPVVANRDGGEGKNVTRKR